MAGRISGGGGNNSITPNTQSASTPVALGILARFPGIRVGTPQARNQRPSASNGVRATPTTKVTSALRQAEGSPRQFQRTSQPTDNAEQSRPVRFADNSASRTTARPGADTDPADKPPTSQRLTNARPLPQAERRTAGGQRTNATASDLRTTAKRPDTQETLLRDIHLSNPLEQLNIENDLQSVSESSVDTVPTSNVTTQNTADNDQNSVSENSVATVRTSNVTTPETNSNATVETINILIETINLHQNELSEQTNTIASLQTALTTEQSKPDGADPAAVAKLSQGIQQLKVSIPTIQQHLKTATIKLDTLLNQQEDSANSRGNDRA